MPRYPTLIAPALAALLAGCAATEPTVATTPAGEAQGGYVCVTLQTEGESRAWTPRAIQERPAGARGIARFGIDLQETATEPGTLDRLNPMRLVGATPPARTVHAEGVLDFEVMGTAFREYREEVTLQVPDSPFAEPVDPAELRRQALGQLQARFDDRLAAEQGILLAAGLGCL